MTESQSTYQTRNGQPVTLTGDNINYKLLEAKAERNAKLSDSDIYIIEDFPTTKKTEWKTYRQALRDMDFSDLDNLTWPTKPE
tara:strand:+ start:588 stop:836 length:249 start_codon:yes stop_codon:yes gene_type:complete